MLVRGAPLIGVTAAYCVAVSLLSGHKKNDLEMICSSLLETRPTAVNLFWALEEMKKTLLSVNDNDIIEHAFKKADEIFEHDIIYLHFLSLLYLNVLIVKSYHQNQMV